MKKDLRIPTLVAIAVLVVGIAVTSFAVNFIQKVLVRADASVVTEVKKSNIKDTSFTVSWVTDTAVSGAVAYKTTGGFATPVSDDRVQAGLGSDKFFTHHVTVNFLKPQTKYEFKIISGGKENTDPAYVVTTAPINTNTQTSYPIYGTVKKADNTVATDAIIYASVNNSTLLSSLTKSQGNWIIPLSIARTADLKEFVKFNPKGDLETIFVQGGKDGVAQVKTITGNDTPVPSITLGKSYDFSKPLPVTPTPTQPSVTSSPEASQDSGFTAPVVVSPTPAILTPNDNATISDILPTFKGTGLPGQVVQIIIHSDQNLAGSAVSDANGRWSWTPTTQLDPGEHTITIATADEYGKTKSITQKFIVLASGTSVVESATPSATLSPSPTVIFTPSPTPTQISTTSGAPVSGNMTGTMLFLVIGFLVIIFGLKLFQYSYNY